MKQSCILLIISITLLLIITGNAHLSDATNSNQFTVNTTLDIIDANVGDGICETASNNGICSLRAAIQEANIAPGIDTIILPAGTYILTIASGQNPSELPDATGDLDIYEEIMILGDHRDTTIIDGNNRDRIFHIACQGEAYPVQENGCEDATDLILFQNITLQRGKHELGAVIMHQFGLLKIIDSRITNNVSTSDSTGGQGAIKSQNGTIYIENTSIDNNRATYATSTSTGIDANNSDLTLVNVEVIANGLYGPAILMSSGTLTVTNSLFSDNRQSVLASQAGFISVSNSTFTNNRGRSIFTYGPAIIANTLFKDNYDSGGAIFSRANLTVSNSIFDDNSTYYDGGAINASATQIIIRDSSITNNIASGNGGGLYIENTPSLLIENSLIANNRSFHTGGGLDLTATDMTMINTTISENRGTQGDAIHLSGDFVPPSALTLTNNTIYGDAVTNLNTSIYLIGGQITLSNNILANNDVGQNCTLTNNANLISQGYNLSTDNSCSLNNNTDLENSDPLLAPLTDNGGRTHTHHLLPNSPALNQIPLNTNGCGTTITTDQRGLPRPQFNLCDLGAYELSEAFTTDEKIYLPIMTAPSN